MDGNGFRQKVVSFFFFFMLIGILCGINAAANQTDSVSGEIVLQNGQNWITPVMYPQKDDLIIVKTDGELHVTMPYGTNTPSKIQLYLMRVGSISNTVYASGLIYNGEYQYFSQPNALYTIREVFTLSNDGINSQSPLFIEFYQAEKGEQFQGITEKFTILFEDLTEEYSPEI